ncbi:SARP family transcriptional regulator [Lentzea tibetensis]|uniref:SARP family transcriptional regulator n=1 Tax=Lentzea tibetensis TaxID=2591470 RepID=A0A563EJ13_9PSEU|nr:AfsR/SARP family transcriptional regulator [Lentzea tibetensis]TWP46837.1 SARP family transcriptional regulator [Lentzea tibetensis]
MEFRILGPVEARDGNGPRPLGGPKPATLLALLASSAGEVVPLDRIVEALWGSRPPKNARATVHTYVSALRKAVTSDVIIRRGGGYVLDVPAEQVDVAEFHRRVAEGGQALRAGRRVAAAQALGSALALWRGGTPLGGAAGEWAEEERARLCDLRLAVLEDQLDACPDVPPVAELVALVAEHPLRERLRAQLMLAFAALGRQADALTCFQEGRRLLADELGIDPGPDLRRAHQRVLAGEPEREPEPAVITPAQLPPDIADFTGRAPELSVLCAHATRTAANAVPLVAISGQPGAGKSTLAVHAAHRLREHYPDGQLHASLRGAQEHPVDPADVLVRFLRALGVPDAAMPESPDERVQLYRTLLAERRVLVVLDDAIDERQVRPLLPGSARCAGVITSRVRLTALEGAEHVELQVLDETESLTLLERLVGGARAQSDPQCAKEIVRLCGHLPLAVRIAGARLAARPDWPLARLAERLRAQHRVLNELAIGDLEVRGSLALSYGYLEPLARKGLRRLGWFGGGEFECWQAGVLLELPAVDAEDVVDDLVRAQLLDPLGGGRFRMHDLTAVFAWERAEAEEPGTDLLAAASRVAERWLLLIEKASGGTPVRLLRPAPSGQVADEEIPDPLAWFEAQQSSLVHAVERVSQLGLVDVSARLAAALCSSSFAVDNRFSLWWRTHSAALAAAEKAGDRSGQGLLLAGLGWLRSEQDRLDEATDYYRQAVEAYESVGDDAQITLVRLMLSGVLKESGDLTGALELLDQVLPRVTDTRMLARASHIRGMTLTELGRLPDALAALEQARTSYQSLDDGHGVALVERSQSIAHRAAGALDVAEALAVRAVGALTDVGDRLMAAYAAQSLAKAVLRQGRGDEVHEVLQQALTTCHEMQDGFGQALVLRTLGELELARDNASEACRYLELSLRWWDALSLPLWRARSLGTLSAAQGALGQADDSDAAWAEAHSVFARLGSREAAEQRPLAVSQNSLRARP